MKLGDFMDSNTHVVNDGNSTSFVIFRENQDFKVTEEITVFKGVRFAEVTFVFQNKGSILFDWLRIPFQSRGELVQYANNIGVVDNDMHMVNQIVLPQSRLGNDVTLEQEP